MKKPRVDACPGAIERNAGAWADRLPSELWLHIFRLVGKGAPRTLVVVVPNVCRRFRSLCRNNLRAELSFRWCRKRLTLAWLDTTLSLFHQIGTVSVAYCCPE